jgi:hypothetical protein
MKTPGFNDPLYIPPLLLPRLVPDKDVWLERNAEPGADGEDW